jgi:riboflavin kinase
LLARRKALSTISSAVSTVGMLEKSTGAEAFMALPLITLAVPRRARAAAKSPRSSERAPGPEALGVLKALAEQGAARDFVRTSSGALAERLGVSQQTASRRILELTRAGLLQRRLAARSQLLRVTPQGVAALRREYELLRAIVEGVAVPALEIRGKVANGLGEGGWYLSRRGYQVAMEKLLGYVPFPGTLNVTLEGAEAEKLEALRAREGLLVEEFQDEGRTFGAVKIFKATLRGRDAAVVLPLRGHHAGVLEVVAPVRLRDALGLRDGDEVAIDVQPA